MGQDIVNEGSNQLFVNTDLSKVFLGNNQTEDTDSYVNNSTYDPITLRTGTVMGRIASTDILVPCVSTASDGSQNVLGILMHPLTLAAGQTSKALICVSGRVAAEQLKFVKPGDGLDTIVSNRRYKDKIGADTVGVKLIYSTNMTHYDNI